MKWIFLTIITCGLIACEQDKNHKTAYYKGVKKKDIALLTVNEYEDRFYGTYVVKYQNYGTESGKIEGEKIGDTLKGRIKYVSYGGNEVVAPFLLLKSNETLKLGSGKVSVLLGITFFVPNTIQFNDSVFQFKKINENIAESLKNEMN